MKKSFFTELDQREFSLLCDFMNESTIDFESEFWRANFMTSLRDYSNEFDDFFRRWQVNKEELLKKVECHTNVQLIELIILIDEFWDKDEADYCFLNQQSPESKIIELLYHTERQEPIQWNPIDTIEKFISESMESAYDFFVNVMDSEKNSKSIWAVKEEDLIGFMLQISKSGQFTRIQRNDGFVKFEFVSFLD